MFTHADIDLLMEGLDSIEKAAQANESCSELMVGMLNAALPDDRRAKWEQMERDRETQREKARLARRRKQEDAYLLRAKLVEYRRSLDSEAADKILADARTS